MAPPDTDFDLLTEVEDYDDEVDDDITIYNFNRDFFRSRNRL